MKCELIYNPPRLYEYLLKGSSFINRGSVFATANTLHLSLLNFILFLMHQLFRVTMSRYRISQSDEVAILRHSFVSSA